MDTLEGKAGNLNKSGDEIWRSANINKAKEEIHIFDVAKVNNKNVLDGDGAWQRITDSEYRMLNKLAYKLKGTKAVRGEEFLDVTGELKIISERTYCPSCQGIIQQFNEMFPNVKLILVDGVK